MRPYASAVGREGEGATLTLPGGAPVCVRATNVSQWRIDPTPHHSFPRDSSHVQRTAESALDVPARPPQSPHPRTCTAPFAHFVQFVAAFFLAFAQFVPTWDLWSSVADSPFSL
jgi:hypothetical protein